jgi:chromosome segregation ATPase
MFSFNASSFALDPSVESFLKSKGAISLDFGYTAYVNAEAMPAILSEMVEMSKANASPNADLVAQLKAEVGRFGTERQKVIEDNIRLASQLRSCISEIAALKEKVDNTARIIDVLKAENLRLQATKSTTTTTTITAAPATVPADPRLKESFEKLQKEFQQLRNQSAEAITSLKVLEEENEELNEELEHLRSQLKNAPSPKASQPLP